MQETSEMSWLSAFLKLNDPIFKSNLKRHITLVPDVYLRNGASSSPFLITLQPTQRCNLKCKMCNQWGMMGNYRQSSMTVASSMPVDVWKNAIQDMAKFKPAILIWGGEPLIYEGILQLVRYIKECRLHCYMITNGMLLDKYARGLMDLRLDGIMVSIDGPKDVHDAIRGVDGCFERAIAGIETLIGLRHQRSQRLLIVMNSVISQYNYEHIEQLVDIGESIGVDVISLFLVLFITREMGEQYQRQMKSVFGCEAQMWKGWVSDGIDIDTSHIRQAIKELCINRFSRTPQVILAPNIETIEIDDFFHDPAKKPRYNRCFQPYFEANILPNGDVNFCYEFQDFVIGNVVEEEFAAIWNNDRAREFRRYLRKNIFSICSKCCKFDVYPISRYIPRRLL